MRPSSWSHFTLLLSFKLLDADLDFEIQELPTSLRLVVIRKDLKKGCMYRVESVSLVCLLHQRWVLVAVNQEQNTLSVGEQTMDNNNAASTVFFGTFLLTGKWAQGQALDWQARTSGSLLQDCLRQEPVKYSTARRLAQSHSLNASPGKVASPGDVMTEWSVAKTLRSRSRVLMRSYGKGATSLLPRAWPVELGPLIPRVRLPSPGTQKE